MNRIGLIFILSLCSAAAQARDYERRSYVCTFQLEQEDMRHAKAQLGSFTATSYITYTEAEELLLPKMVLTPASSGVDPTEWSIVERRIRTDLEASTFAFDRHVLLFTGAFNLNFDGVYTLIRALGGKSLADTDDLTLTDPRDHDREISPDDLGRFRFSFGRGITMPSYAGGPHGTFANRVQAHLPLAEKDGLSFHLQTNCEGQVSGVY